MTTEATIEAFLNRHPPDASLPYTEGYQMLFEELGDALVPGLLRLLQSPDPDIRGTCIGLLSVRRPHEAHVAAAIAPLIRDAHGYVMLTATDKLAGFPLSMIEPFLGDAYQMFHDHLDAEDVVPSIAAMRLCLRSDFDSYKDALLPRLLAMLDTHEGFEQFLLLMTLQELGLAEEDQG